MMADSDLQVWLDTVERTRPGVVIPYVQSDQSQALRYRVKVTQTGAGGQAVIGQSGALSLLANTPAALSTLALSRRPGDQCQIEIIITGSDKKARNYRFDCPS